MRGFMIISFCAIIIALLGQAGLASDASANLPRLPANDKLAAQMDQENLAWAASLSRGAEDQAKYYLDAAVIFDLDGRKIIKGKNEIQQHFQKNKGVFAKIPSIEAVARYQAASDLVYEIGSFTADNQEQYQYLLIRRCDQGTWLRELEVIAKKAPGPHDAGGIDRARQNWMKLCGEHNPPVLIENLYASDAVYYNLGRVLRGREAIADEYGYMANSGYTLGLTPGTVSMATDATAFEIGGCSGSYRGLYILVWGLEKDGAWRIQLDSNN